MKHKSQKILVLTLVCFLGLATSAFCLSYTTTAGDNSPLAGISFGLSYINAGYTIGGYSVYNATLTITTPNTPSTSTPWYADYFLFKLAGGGSTPANIIAPTGWTAVPPDQAINWPGGTQSVPPNGGFSGLLLTSMIAPANNAAGGFLVDPSSSVPYSLQFSFYGITPPSLTDPNASMPFQVGFFSPNATGGGFTQLSVALVPEPATVLLLGSGLIGIWGFRKKFKR